MRDLTRARKLDNYEKDATGATAKWPDTTHFIATVPAGKRWFLFGGNANRAVSSTMNSYVKDPSDNTILTLSYHGASTGSTPFPIATYAGTHIFPWPMDVGDYVELLFGTAQNANSYASVHVLEIDI